jgi:DNA-binding Lrp family transcriptional regulator
LKACILVKTDTGKHGAVAKKLSQFPSVRLCFPVLGQADVVVKVEVRDTEELTRTVQEILSLRGVSETETLVESEA